MPEEDPVRRRPSGELSGWISPAVRIENRGRIGTRIGDVAKNDKLCPQDLLPPRPSQAAPHHRLVDGLRADAEDRGQGRTGVAEDLYPEVGDPIPRPGKK